MLRVHTDGLVLKLLDVVHHAHEDGVLVGFEGDLGLHEKSAQLLYLLTDPRAALLLAQVALVLTLLLLHHALQIKKRRSAVVIGGGGNGGRVIVAMQQDQHGG